MPEQMKFPPVIGFSAFSGTGKTTLLKKVIAELRARDIRIAVIKHAHDDFDVDHPGKDSYELRKADVYQTLIASSRRKALITEFEAFQQAPTLNDLLADLDHENIDLILVEGYTREHFAKIELHRAGLDKPYLFENDSDIIALATDHPVDAEADLLLLDMNDARAIAGFIYDLVYS
jgi:molybdopterin-guanine dinucleotide biosynthesis protein B